MLISLTAAAFDSIPAWQVCIENIKLTELVLAGHPRLSSRMSSLTQEKQKL